MQFRAELEATGGTTTGLTVPDEVVEGLAGGQRPKVVATVNGYEFRSSIARMGGRFMLGMSAERRTAAGVAAGDVLDVDVRLDTAPREVDLPEDLGAALARNAEAQAFWATLSHSKQQWHVLQVTGAKKPETRTARVEKSVAMLSEHRAR